MQSCHAVLNNKNCFEKPVMNCQKMLFWCVQSFYFNQTISQSAPCTCVEILNERLQEEKHEVPTLKLRHCKKRTIKLLSKKTNRGKPTHDNKSKVRCR